MLVVIHIKNGTKRGKCNSMPWFSKRVMFLRHLNGLLNHRLKHRLHRSTQDDDGDSVEEAKDAAFASMIKHCEGNVACFVPLRIEKAEPTASPTTSPLLRWSNKLQTHCHG